MVPRGGSSFQCVGLMDQIVNPIEETTPGGKHFPFLFFTWILKIVTVLDKKSTRKHLCANINYVV